MNELNGIRIEQFRQFKKEILGSREYEVVGIDVGKGDAVNFSTCLPLILIKLTSYYVPISYARVQDRQMTCGDPHCRREWHRRKCAEWNRKNEDYFRTNYLQNKLDELNGSRGSPSRSRFQSKLPRGRVQEVIGVEHLVIMEYLVQLLWRRFQEVIRVQVAVRTG